MKRIMVIGVSSGVGKSTFARRLGEALNINVYHLDAYYWEPNWVEATLEKFSNAQKEIVAHEQWIIDGNYSSTFEIRTEHADTIIYLELPLYVCLVRVVQRWLLNIGRTRIDIGEGCKEKLDWKFIKFIYTTYHARKKKMADRFQKIQASGTNIEIITLKNKKEIESFFHRFKD